MRLSVALLATALAWGPVRAQCDCSPVGSNPHGAWHQIVTPSSPPGRMNHGLVYDSKRGVAVLFGGANSCVDRTPLNDTWEFDGANWRQVVVQLSEMLTAEMR
jgi:hypothetical protein